MSDNTPTERFDNPVEPAADTKPIPADPTPPAPGRRGNRGLVVLAIVGVVLLVAVAVVLTLFFTRGGSPVVATPAPTSSAASPAASPEPSPSASEDDDDSDDDDDDSDDSGPGADPAPGNSGPRFTKLDAEDDLDGCSPGGPGFEPTRPGIEVTWKAKSAQSVWIVQGTDDAADSMFMELPVSGDERDFPFPITLDCSTDSSTYTMTIVGDDGTHVSESFTVRNDGEKF